MAALPDLGFIYVVQMAGHDIYKIGRSTDPPRRFSGFGLQLPFPFVPVLAHKVREHCQVERSLHEKFHTKRMNGDWFALDGADLVTIRSILLYWQAVSLQQRVFNSVVQHMRDGWKPCYVDMFRFGRLLMRLSVRIDRRLRIGDPPLPSDPAPTNNHIH